MNRFESMCCALLVLIVLALAEHAWMSFGLPPAPFIIGFLTAAAYYEARNF